MLNLTIRPAVIGDVAAIHEMICELAVYEKEPAAVLATEIDLENKLFSPNPAVFAHIAEVDGKVIGFAIWFLNYSTWLGKHGIYLEDLFVKPEARANGVGKALLRALAALCLERDYGRLEWWVLDWNSPAIDFYRAQGAVAMDEWTVHRLTGNALKDFAAGAAS